MQENERDLVVSAREGKQAAERNIILVPIETMLWADIDDDSYERWERTEGLNLRLEKQRFPLTEMEELSMEYT